MGKIERGIHNASVYLGLADDPEVFDATPRPESSLRRAATRVVICAGTIAAAGALIFAANHGNDKTDRHEDKVEACLADISGAAYDAETNPNTLNMSVNPVNSENDPLGLNGLTVVVDGDGGIHMSQNVSPAAADCLEG